jgi:tRNA threonylcarbamoyladenosine biosynthesis protein TsaB
MPGGAVSPLILAIDTTHEFGSLALLDGGRCDEELLHAPDGFGTVLYDRLGRLLARNGRAVAEVDCFAATSGPGSFTGVRIGLACVKGLADALGKPVVAVSNLAAMASFCTAPLRAAVLDARRGEVYGAVYGADGEAVAPECVMRFPAWLETLPEGDLEFVAMDFAPFRPSLAGTRFADVAAVTAPRALAGAVAAIARRRFAAGQAGGAAAVDANYVRRSDAELLWKDR